MYSGLSASPSFPSPASRRSFSRAIPLWTSAWAFSTSPAAASAAGCFCGGPKEVDIEAPRRATRRAQIDLLGGQRLQLCAVGALVHEWRLLPRLDGGLQPLERGRPAVPDVARGDGRGELAEALEHDVVLHSQERPVGGWAQAVAPAGK